MLLKLSAYMPISKDLVELGPTWMDAYVRATLSEAVALGLEVGIVDGDGKEKPIGMTSDVSDTANVQGGVYPVSYTHLDVYKRQVPMRPGGLESYAVANAE